MKARFEQYFGTLPPGHNPKINCVWHEDKNASLYLDYDTGKAFCFGCNTGYFIEDLLKGAEKTIDMETVVKFHDHLMSPGEAAMRRQYKKVKGWTEDVLKEYMIGYNGSRVTIPVWKDKIGGTCINLRCYSTKCSPKMINFGKGYGTNAWFPYPPNTPEIYLMEGESDTILARSMGLPAFTQTGGAGSWCNQFTRDLADKKVNIIYDQDRAGQTGAQSVVNALKYVCEIRNLRLPVSSARKDFCDWVLLESGDLSQLAELKAGTAPYAVSKLQVSVANPVVLPLYETANARWAYKAVQCDVVVAGKDRAPYMIPYKYSLECQPDKRKPICISCPNRSGLADYTLSWIDGKLTRFVDMPENFRDGALRELSGLPIVCKSAKTEIKEYQNIEKLALFPRKDSLTVDVDAPSEINMLRKAYFLGIGVQTNATYTIRGISIPDTRDQTSVLLIVEAEPVDTVEEITDLTPCSILRLDPEEEQTANVEGQKPSGEL